MDRMRHFDELFEETNQYGVYQALFFFLLQWNSMSAASSAVAGFYMLGGLKPTYVCHDDGFNSTDACYTIRNCQNLTTISIYRSIYEEFDWACVSSQLIYTMASLMPVAALVGYVVSGHLADWFGRKWVIYIGLIYSIAANIYKSWIPAWEHYFVLLLISAFIAPMSYNPAFALAMETVGKKYRLLQSFAFQWIIAYMVNGLVAYLVLDWRTHLRVMYFANLPVLVLWIFLAESPRWLIQKKRYKQAAGAINRIARCNGKGKKTFTEKDMTNVDIGVQKQHSQYNILHMFYTKKLTLYTISQCCTGICINLVNSVILMNVQDLAGSPFVNVGFFGLLRLWSPFVVLTMDRQAQWFGRRLLFLSSQGTIAFCFICICVLHFLGLWHRFHAIGTAFALIGYAVNVGVLWVAYKQYATELYPTVIRSIALSACSLASLVGTALAPQFIFLKEYWAPLPYAAAAVWASVVWILGYAILPETRGKPLPDTLEDVRLIELQRRDAKTAAAKGTIMGLETDHEVSTPLTTAEIDVQEKQERMAAV